MSVSPVDLFFIVLSAVIFGGALTGYSMLAITRYSRAEETGQRPKAFPDLVLVIGTGALCLFGLWIAGLFG